MKKLYVLGLPFICSFIICCTSLDDSYRGYILFENRPLIRAKVLEEGTNNYTFTDKEGYFTLERSSKNFICNLIIQADGLKINDTIRLAGQSGADSPRYFLFLSKNKDSLDIHRSRFFKAQSGNSKFNYQYSFGYITYKKKPIYNAKVTGLSTGKQTYTDYEGFFYLKRSDVNQVDKLIIQEEGSHKKDTIELLRKGSDGKPYSLFFRNEKDSIGYQYNLDLYEERKNK